VRDSRRARQAFDSRLADARTDPQVLVQGKILGAIVPADVLELMVKRVWQCWTDYKEVLDGAMTPEIDRATEGIKQCLCRELARIRDLNKGIPDGELRKWWDAYCNKQPSRQHGV
jgi:hypothetical protein